MPGFDALTGLPDRYLFSDRLSQAIGAAKRSGRQLALLYFDLDEFKSVNDTLGHSAGDELLKEIASRLTEIVRSSDSVARLGGDEFAIIETDVEGAAAAGSLALRLLDALSRPLTVAGQKIHTSASIGIALSSPGDTGEELMRQADRALYKAKENGRGSFHFHDQELAREVRTYVTLREELFGAIERAELFLEYQPQVELSSGRIVGSEALVRWQHPQRGLLAPGLFIPAAERSGLIIPLGTWVLEEACRQRKRWSDDGVPAVPVAVNLSAAQFQDRRFAESLRRVLRQTGVNPHLLELELTESILMQRSDAILQVLSQANEQGIRFSIDDFGTGYSSLRYLREFPVHKLKIAMEFVHGVTTDSDDASIVSAVIQLGHTLGLKVIAEGVETEAQVEFLLAHHCDQAQGFYFARPIAPDAFAEELLHTGYHSRRRPLGSDGRGAVETRTA